jgi:uncharacterized protein (TIGR04222 family)
MAHQPNGVLGVTPLTLRLYADMVDAMNDEQRSALRARIEAFSLDVPGASFPFSKKLAIENHWTPAYTRRVIEEYKRFSFMAVAAGHPVSPSEAVDQAWHMHLTYTQNYWKVFCADVLQTPLHHNPTQGGRAERDKFDDWYRRTLESYRTLFQSEPPTDIWPTPEDKQSAPQQFVRVDKADHWVIRKPKVNSKGQLAIIAVLSVFILGCSGAVAGANPFDWMGPDFLRFYVLLTPMCIALGCWARYSLLVPISSSGPGPHLDGYQMAYLNKGKWLTIDAAIASLVQKQVLGFDPKQQVLFPTSVQFAGGHTLEEFIYGIANQPTGVRLRHLRQDAGPQADRIGEDLKRMGLYVADDQVAKILTVPLLVAAIAPVIGIMKIMVGISRDRPVSNLVGLCFVSLIVILIVFVRKPGRSRYGDAVLSQLQEHYDHMRHLGHHHAVVSTNELAVAIGLFGMTTLVGSDLGFLATSMRTPPSSSSGCSGSIGSCSSGGSCGGGGGGDGGGGGGCGGGGCGGCGGG